MQRHSASPRSRASTIDELARQTGRSYEEARAAYEEQLARLESQAKVKMYVPVIARRLAREALARQH